VAAANPRPAVETIIPWLTGAALVELLVLRVFTRTAIHIPALEQLSGPYGTIASFGRYAYYVAIVLLIAALPVVCAALWRRADLASRAAAAALVAFALLAVAARAGAAGTVLLDAVAIGVVILAGAAALARMEPRALVVPGAFAVAFAFSGGHTLLQDAASSNIRAFDSRWMLSVAEIVAVAFGILAPFGLRAVPGRRGLVASALVAGLLFLMVASNPATFKILLLWNEGLSGAYPAVAYALAAGGLSAASIALLRQGRTLAACALLLLLLGGVGLHSTYQTGLVVLGFCAFVLASPPVRTAPLPR
jgi:hypothetical protein